MFLAVEGNALRWGLSQEKGRGHTESESEA